MEQERPSYLEQISQSSWEKTLTSVKKLVESMAGGIEKLERHVTELLEVQQHLSEKVNRTSLNSSSPADDRIPKIDTRFFLPAPLLLTIAHQRLRQEFFSPIIPPERILRG